MIVTTSDLCQQDGCQWVLPAAIAPATAYEVCTHMTVDS